MIRSLTTLLFIVTISTFSFGQMMIDGEIKYGNEWIQYDQSYVKMTINEDGVYRLNTQELEDMGVPINTLELSKIQLFNLGAEVSLFTSTEGIAGNGDYILFSGKKNVSNIDRFFYEDENDLFNNNISLITDEASYYITWNANDATKRYTESTYDLTGTLTPEPYFMAHSSREYTEGGWVKNYVKSGPVYLNFSHYDLGEGWAKYFNSGLNENLTLPQLYTNTPVDGKFTTSVTTLAYLETHVEELKINNIPYDTITVSGYQELTFDVDVPASELQNAINFKINQISTDPGAHKAVIIGNYDFTYPHTFNMENTGFYKFKYPASPTELYFEITNFDDGGQQLFLFDDANDFFIVPTVENGLLKFKVPASENDYNFTLISSNEFKSLLKSKPISFTDYSTIPNINYVMLTHPFLNNADGGVNYVQEYANYRSTVQGGSHVPQIINIEELYDQFAYGIHWHPMSIRNFSHYIQSHWTDIKAYIILGKGLSYKGSRFISTDDEIANEALIPSWGDPQSDVLLLASNTVHTPIAPIGRVAARSPDKLRIYLDKVIAFEGQQNAPQTIEGKAWMKKYIHLAGGKSASEQSSFATYLDNIRDKLEAAPVGADVHSFYKTSSDPIAASPRQEVTRLINEGITALTFFGHSSPEIFDFTIDPAPLYENEGKYPFIFSLGCSAGNIFSSNIGLSEEFIFEENKGAIAFYASTSSAFPSALRSFHTRFFEDLTGDYYDKSIGEIMQNNIAFHEDNTSTSIEYLKEQLLLHGDPALKLNTHKGPDYLTDRTSFSNHPSILNTTQDNFDISFDVYNIGSANLDSIDIKIQQKLPNGEIHDLKEYRILSPTFKVAQNINLPLVSENALGENRIIIIVDSNNAVEERPNLAAENNNTITDEQGIVGMPVYIVDDNINPNWPANFGIVNDTDLTLKSTTSNPFADERKYIIQIDTTTAFDSPQMLEKQFVQLGGVVSWQPEINWENNQVYYWRTTADSTESVGYNWNNSSFLFLDNIPKGWNQSHYFQYLNDPLETIELDTMTRDFEYVTEVKNLDVECSPFYDVGTYVNLNSHQIQILQGGMPTNSIWVSVFDGVDLEPWINPVGGIHNSTYTGPIPIKVFPYTVALEEGRTNLTEFMNNIIPDDSYVLITSAAFPSHDLGVNEWANDSIASGTNLFQTFEAQGASLIRKFQTEGFKSYSFFYRKNNPDYQPLEFYDDAVHFNTNITINWYEGTVTSPKIGPAQSWENIKWALDDFDAVSDHAKLDVIGIKADNTEEIILSNQSDFEIDIQNIDAQTYPYLRLQYKSIDTLQRTHAGLDYWRVHYLEQPDLALDKNTYFNYPKDTLQQGEPIVFEIGIENISNVPMDSCQVSYIFRDSQNESQTFQRPIPALAAGETYNAALDMSTATLQGNINFGIHINKEDLPNETTQLNNYSALDLYVGSDILNPLLDVTFDGNHIINGALVSSKPEIVINLLDENIYLLLEDTSTIKVSIKMPNDNQFTTLDNSHPDIEFVPAQSGQDNSAQVYYTPTFVQDGTYTLRAQGLDQTGNISGQFQYEVTFEVITQSSISSIVNYPNPFTESTQFVYTLTGSPEDIPDDYYIQILTVSGKIVKTITADEIGPLSIGQHRTDYAWDGSDDYGDRLANGVYLYRFEFKNNGQNATEHRSTKVDDYFKNGYGKLVLLK